MQNVTKTKGKLTNRTTSKQTNVPIVAECINHIQTTDISAIHLHQQSTIMHEDDQMSP